MIFFLDIWMANYGIFNHMIHIEMPGEEIRNQNKLHFCSTFEGYLKLRVSMSIEPFI
jgi:hypothetical protein